MANFDTDAPINVNDQPLSPIYNIVFFIIMLVVTSCIFYVSLKDFSAKDTAPTLLHLTPERLREFGATQTVVEVGMYIKDFPEFNATQERFVVDATVWFLFDSRVISLARISAFTFDKASVLKKSEPRTRADKDYKIFAYYDVRVQFEIPLNFEKFPFDNHRLSFVVANESFTPHEVIFKSTRSNLAIGPDFSIEGWRFIDKEVRTGYSEDEIKSGRTRHSFFAPRVIFLMDFERSGIRYILSIILPLLLIYFVTLFSLSFDPRKNKKYDMVNMASGSIAALIAYRFVIESLSPNVGYMMISDKIFLFFLVIITMVFLTTIFLEYTKLYQRKIVTIVLHCVTILFFLYLLWPEK